MDLHLVENDMKPITSCSAKISFVSVATAVLVLWMSVRTDAANLVHWRLDETSGTVAGDSSGNGIDGIWQGTSGTPGWEPGEGMAGGAYLFSGFDLDSFIAEPVEGFGTLPFTISLWMNSTFSANGGLGYLGNGSGNQYYVVRSQGGVARANARNTAEVNCLGSSINDGEWHHLVGVYAGTDDRAIYVDGLLEGSNTEEVPELALTRFGIGALTRNTPYNPADLFEGLLDDVQLYDTALTDEEILFLYENPGNALDEVNALQAGDADQDYDFDQIDIVRVSVAAKYLTGQAATWGDGDWDGAPGGEPGNPPEGNGLFDQVDIIASLTTGNYLAGPYAAIKTGGMMGDGQASVTYNPSTGEVGVNAPAGTDLTSVNIDSASGIFTGDPAQNLGGSFDNDSDSNIFKATFGGSFGALTFGNVAQTGLSEEFLANDLTVVGSLSGGGDLGPVDLIYVPEPAAALLMLIGCMVGLLNFRHKR
jgi:hypothetical protein